MTKSLSERDRALVDAAVAEGRVTRVDPPPKRRGRAPSPEVAARRERIAELARQGRTVPEICEATAQPEHTVRNDLRIVGLSPGRRRAAPVGDVASEVKASRVEPARRRARDRRRFKVTPVPVGEPAIEMAPDHPAVVHGRPTHMARVFQVDGAESVLKDGASSAKIGGDVLVGALKGAIILTLTLPERQTCPRSCPIWRGCYGNSMHYARRWEPGGALEAAIRDEIPGWCAQNPLVLVRLHILGDFYSLGYVQLWRELLALHPTLHVFGFTAREPGTPIGDALAAVAAAFPARWHMRTSGRCGRMGSFTIPFPTDRKFIGDAVVCPEQRSALGLGRPGVHCGSCALCWETDRAVAFIEH